MERQSESQRQSLKSAVSRYHQAITNSPAEEYLNQRGLGSFSELEKYRLGYVEDPLPEHEMHRGKLAIPFLRKHPRHGWTCVSIRFRSLDDSKPKYASMAGDRPRLYNTQALNQPGLVVGVCEGEIDALTATLAGLPTVGIPGAQMWQPHYADLFRGYREVRVFTDGDEPGEKLGRTIAKAMSNAKIIPCQPGEDLNSILTSQGVEALREKLQIKKGN